MDCDQARSLLGLNEGASHAEIKRAYRDLMRTVHPDKHGGDPAAARLAVLANSAKDVLLAAADVWPRSYRSTEHPPWDETPEEEPFDRRSEASRGEDYNDSGSERRAQEDGERPPSTGASQARPAAPDTSGAGGESRVAGFVLGFALVVFGLLIWGSWGAPEPEPEPEGTAGRVPVGRSPTQDNEIRPLVEAEEALALDRAGWRRIQEGLAVLELDPGASDGIAGVRTRQAIRAYQEGAGKPATGFLDATDVAALHHAASEVIEQQMAAAAAETDRLAESWPPGRIFRDACDGCPEMVVIPAGDFLMGSSASEEGRDSDEGPQHRVTLKSFALGVTEVTFDEWEACVRASGCNGRRPDDEGWGRGARPVIDVSWEDVQAYVSWLSGATGTEYRLPSESEWEYAARAGTTTPFHTGTTISTDEANYDGKFEYGSDRRSTGMYRERTTPVKTFAPNAFGLYDVHGNVWEWVEDCWRTNYAGAPKDGTAWTSDGNCRRVLRGGSWFDFPRLLRSTARLSANSMSRDFDAGFRVARTLD